MSIFDSRDDVAVYRDHSDYVKVAEFIGQVRVHRAVVDYKMQEKP